MTLDGTASSGSISSYSWQQTAGPSVALTGANTPHPSFVARNLPASPVTRQTILLSFQLTIADSYGNGSSAVVGVQVTTTPTPGAIFATPGNAATTVGWNLVGDASSYNLYWSTSPNVSKATANRIEGVTPPYVHASLDNGTTYYYGVTAVHLLGALGTRETDIAAEASATPSATPVDGSWEPPVAIGPVIPPGGDQNVVFADSGDGIAIWQLNNTSSPSEKFFRMRGWHDLLEWLPESV